MTLSQILIISHLSSTSFFTIQPTCSWSRSPGFLLEASKLWAVEQVSFPLVCHHHESGLQKQDGAERHTLHQQSPSSHSSPDDGVPRRESVTSGLTPLGVSFLAWRKYRTPPSVIASLNCPINPLAGWATFLSPTVHGRSDNIVVWSYHVY